MLLGESKWIIPLFVPNRIKDNSQRSVFLIFGAGDVPLLLKPVKSIYGIVRF